MTSKTVTFNMPTAGELWEQVPQVNKDKAQEYYTQPEQIYAKWYRYNEENKQRAAEYEFESVYRRVTQTMLTTILHADQTTLVASMFSPRVYGEQIEVYWQVSAVDEYGNHTRLSNGGIIIHADGDIASHS